MFEEVDCTVKAPTKVTKKRKSAEDDTEKDELRHEARTLCCSSEQWKVVSKYPTSKLREWVDMKKFDSDRKVADNIVQRGVQLFGSAVDRLLGADGYISAEFDSDVVLVDSVKQEVGGFLRLLNNKVRILFSAGNNVFSGLAKRPIPTITIEEEKGETYVFNEETNPVVLDAACDTAPEKGEDSETREEDSNSEMGGQTDEVPLAS